MPAIRIGILGAARIAPKAVIVPARHNPEFTVVAVAARDKAKAEAFASEHQIPHVAQDYAELVRRDDVDLVYNALPPKGHPEWCIAALKAGKAVLCEKPFALTAADAYRMVETAERTQGILVEAYHYRFHAFLRRALDIVRAGEIGKLIEAEAVFDTAIPYKPDEIRWLAEQGGGALMDLGCYCVHVLRTFTGEEPKIASAECTVEHGVDATTRALLAFPGGLQAKLHTTMQAEKFSASLFLKGDKGTLAITNFVVPQLGSTLTVEAGGKRFEEEASGPTSYAAQLAHMGDVMLRGADPVTGGKDAIATMECIESIYAKAGFERAL